MFAIVATGFGDDVWGWDPRLKIMGQLVAAAGLSLFGIGTQTASAFLAYFVGTGEIMFEVPVFGGIPINVTEVDRRGDSCSLGSWWMQRGQSH